MEGTKKKKRGQRKKRTGEGSRRHGSHRARLLAWSGRKSVLAKKGRSWGAVLLTPCAAYRNAGFFTSVKICNALNNSLDSVMAECSLATLRGQYGGKWTQSNNSFSSRNMPNRMLKRNQIHKIHSPCHSNAAREWKNSSFTPSGSPRRSHRVETLVKYSFLEPLMDSESMVSPKLVLISDEALLSISIVFAYLAGVVPSGQTFPRAKNQRANQHPTAPSPHDSGI